jgi:hypothetical protein
MQFLGEKYLALVQARGEYRRAASGRFKPPGF